MGDDLTNSGVGLELEGTSVGSTLVMLMLIDLSGLLR